MNIPVVDLFAPYSIAHVHPYWTALMIGVLIALGGFILWVSFYTRVRLKKLRWGLFVVYLALALPMVWTVFKPERRWPSPESNAIDPGHRINLRDAILEGKSASTPN